MGNGKQKSLIIKTIETKDGNIITTIQNGDIPKDALPQAIMYENEFEQRIYFCPNPSGEIFQECNIEIPCFLCKHATITSDTTLLCKNKKSLYYNTDPENPNCNFFKFFNEGYILVTITHKNGETIYYRDIEERYHILASED